MLNVLDPLAENMLVGNIAAVVFKEDTWSKAQTLYRLFGRRVECHGTAVLSGEADFANHASARLLRSA
jgi:hypothetical protein